ncbi:CMRF35-like molecule 8 [Sardina pilchardus]|uniref:CMRF35-like molecule 8 n=1 Tax=Sardina pilchardus TaxID=27697 RepID=UPI002E14EDBC
METQLIVFFCLLAGAHPVESVIQVTGYVGRSVVIKCPYNRRYVVNSKYLCRGACVWGNKDMPIRTEAGQTKAINGRFSLHDDTTAGVFTVTITELTEKDSGQYWCGVNAGFGRYDVFTEVKLKVKVLPPSPNPTLMPSTEDHTLSSSSSSNTLSSSFPSTVPTSNSSQTQHVLDTTKTVFCIYQPTAAEHQKDQKDPKDPVVMVILCVLALFVLVTVCGLVSAFYYRQRRKQTPAQ